MKIAMLIACLAIAAPLAARAEGFVDLEVGAVFTGMNDVRIPGRYGTPFSLTGVLRSTVTPAARVRAGYTIAGRHTVALLAAPLTVTAAGRSSRDLYFNGALFPAGLRLRGSFMFNTYRLTYRYDIVSNKTVEFGLGLTGAMRHAAVRLETLGTGRQRPDLGFVPLINTRLLWRMGGPLGLLVDADWLATPQGRAEDILVALQYRHRDNLRLRLGYRLLEGGGRNAAVTTFSLFHYIVAGVDVHFE